MSILVRRCLHRTHLVEELVESWQINHVEAMLERELEELVRECLELSNLLDYGWKSSLDCLFHEEIDNIDFIGKMLRLAIERTLVAFQEVQNLIEKAHRNGFAIEGASDFRIALDLVKELKIRAAKDWPSVDHELIKASKEAYLRGEYQTAEEMLHDLQNPTPQAH